GTASVARAMASCWHRRPAALSPPAILSEREWSQMATYSYPRRLAAAAISSKVERPSLQVEWTWRSPRMSPGTSSSGSSPASAFSISRSEEHTSELQSRENLVCRLLREKKKLLHKWHSPLRCE